MCIKCTFLSCSQLAINSFFCNTVNLCLDMQSTVVPLGISAATPIQFKLNDIFAAPALKYYNNLSRNKSPYYSE